MKIHQVIINHPDQLQFVRKILYVVFVVLLELVYETCFHVKSANSSKRGQR